MDLQHLHSTEDDALVIAGDVYKQTIVADYVVKRYVRLYRDRFITSRHDHPDEQRVFLFDHAARLVPADRALIERRKRHIRPPGVGSMTALAAIRGKGQPVQLWSFKLDASEYSFKFCFEDQATAYRWHELLTQIIDNLRAAAGLTPISPAKHPSATSWAPADSVTLPATNSAANSDLGRAADAASNGLRGSQLRLKGTDSCHSAAFGLAGDAEDSDDAELQRIINSSTAVAAGNGSSSSSGNTPDRRQMRWVPYKHSNGLAIYAHKGNVPGAAEFMVSAVVRGTPLEVLKVLLDPDSATTILGPALEVEVLDSAPAKQVLRIQLQAVGPTAGWFRPREAVVQRFVKKESDGVYAVLFSSVEHAAAAARARQRQEGVVEVADDLRRIRRSNPIRCRVSGGYTISKLAGVPGSSSQETLLTCILEVSDMGGWLNPSHPLFHVVEWWSGGAYEAFLERMLLGVMLVRDVVEKSRFALRPMMFNVAPPRWTPEQETADLAGAGAMVPRSSTIVIRRGPGSGMTGDMAAALAAASPFVPMSDAPYASNSFTGSEGSAPVGDVKQKFTHRTRLASLRLPDSVGLGSTPSKPSAGLMAVDEWDPSFKLPHQYYCEIHTPGTDHPFKVRGATYLTDGHKVQAGQPVFELVGMEVVDTGGSGPMPHICRFLPSVRRNPKPFLFAYNLMVPGPPTVCCVFVFGSDSHPDALGPPPDDPEETDWEPFDFLMSRFIHGDDDERRSLFKMIPRIAEGSWVIKQSVGTTPVIIGRKLTTSFHITSKYVEVAVDVGSSTTAAYVTGMVRGGAKSLVIDLGVLLEGQNTWELPEQLLGAVRVKKLDLSAASKLDDSREVPILHVPYAKSSSLSKTAPEPTTSELSSHTSA